MRVIISAGGTGGHIYPALAIINKIKELEPNSEFLYIGTHNRMENEIIPKKNIPFIPIEIYGLYRKKIYKNFKTIYFFLKAIKKTKKIIKEFKPDIVIGTGGYVTVPVIYSANKLNIKTFIHEQNSICGTSNTFLSKYATKIGVSFISTLDKFPKDKVIYTGNPCSEEAIKKQAISKKEFGLNENKKIVLIVMGSLGATTINEFLINTLHSFEDVNYEILFVTGKKDFEKTIKNKFPDNVKIVPYIEDMTRIMKKVDVIVSRAGASTLSEIIALQIPSVLIPSPYVPNNHQYKNAMDLVNNGASLIIEEKDLKGDILKNKIEEILNNQVKIEKMKKNLKQLSIPNSATIIVENIFKLLDRKY